MPSSTDEPWTEPLIYSPGDYAPNFEGAKEQKRGSSFGKSKREYTFIKYSDGRALDLLIQIAFSA